MQTSAHGTERRSQMRMRCLKTGHVVLANGNSTLACRIRSRSQNGIRLVSDELALVPDTFALVHEPSQGQTISQSCRVAWRGNGEIGAVLLGPSKAETSHKKHRESRTRIIHRYPV